MSFQEPFIIVFFMGLYQYIKLYIYSQTSTNQGPDDHSKTGSSSVIYRIIYALPHIAFANLGAECTLTWYCGQTCHGSEQVHALHGARYYQHSCPHYNTCILALQN